MYAVEVLNLGGVRAALERARAEIDDWMPLWHDIGEIMAQHVHEVFATEGYGTWEPLQLATVQQKLRAGYPPDPMIRTGRLFDSLSDPEEAGRVEQGRSTLGTFTEKAYSYGTEVRNERGQTYAEFHADTPEHNPNLPVRNMIIVTPRLLADVEHAAREFLRAALRRAGIEPRG